jgi:hypothetical protein
VCVCSCVCVQASPACSRAYLLFCKCVHAYIHTYLHSLYDEEYIHHTGKDPTCAGSFGQPHLQSWQVHRCEHLLSREETERLLLSAQTYKPTSTTWGVHNPLPDTGSGHRGTQGTHSIGGFHLLFDGQCSTPVFCHFHLPSRAASCQSPRTTAMQAQGGSSLLATLM